MSWEALFPFTARINAAQHLEIGGCDASDIAEQFGTPLYIYDETTLREQAGRAINAFRSRWENVTVLYATKAYFAPFIARLDRELGLGLDVTSEAEMVIAQRAGFDSNTIYVHGNNKTPAEVCAALNNRITHFVIDNLDEISNLQLLTSNFQPPTPKLQLLLRLSPNIDAHTHRYMTTGVADSKFGLGIQNGMAEEAAREILARAQAGANFELVGLHFHIGSQVFDTDALRDALYAVLDVAAEWQHRFGFQLRELNIGGGWGVAYNEAQTALDIETFAENTVRALREGLRARGLNESLRLVVEPGRGLVARAGVALYRVGAVKNIPGVRNYIAVDGGMGDNIRPALYGARYQAFLSNRMNDAASQEYAIVGRYCEQGDILIERAQLPEARVGDLLAIPIAGAYQLPMASNYNLIPRPAVVLVQEGRARLVRRRETVQDMLACDLDD
ncbi:MAG TPA: diaminopimelate decarboxylase [Anaerolineae bacterium]|nr:diaminopimelate decarboxylase [Anaerolineae bacterium]